MLDSYRTPFNAAERKLLGTLLLLFRKARSISTIDWAKRHRIISKRETSFGEGKFNPDLTPYMEYVYDILDSPLVPSIVAKKSARIAWTETLNNYRGKRIHIDPTTMLVGFPTAMAAKVFAKEKWNAFLDNVPVVKDLVNQGIAENKKSFYDYAFPGGHLRFGTLGSIANQKSANLEYIEIEEPDDAPDDVQGQGDTFTNLKERQKLVPLTKRKFIFGGTPTFKDFSRVEQAIRASNDMVFKAECHGCHELVAMDGSSFKNLHIDVYQDMYIDEIYGKYNPHSVKFLCPFCGIEWSFEQKNKNIINGKKHGITDTAGLFTKGWHPRKPEVTDVYGLNFSEMLSPFEGSHFVELAKAKILAEKDLLVGKELLMKSFTNNKMGESYSSGYNSMEPDEMKLFRKNYPEGIVPMEGLVAFAGIDVQDNRFAYVIRAWGRNGISYLVKWEEIFGDVTNPDDKVWKQLADTVVNIQLQHASGKPMPITSVSIDAADNSELVYNFALRMSEYNTAVLPTRGVRDLRYSEDEIYKEPSLFDIQTTAQVRKSLSERMGVTLYNVGAHRAHQEVLRRMSLVKMAKERPEDYKSDFMYWNHQSYGFYEEQVCSCRKLFVTDSRTGTIREIYKLIPGKRKEAVDCEKMALHSAYAHGIRQYTPDHWEALERFYWN